MLLTPNVLSKNTDSYTSWCPQGIFDGPKRRQDWRSSMWIYSLGDIFCRKMVDGIMAGAYEILCWWNPGFRSMFLSHLSSPRRCIVVQTSIKDLVSQLSYTVRLWLWQREAVLFKKMWEAGSGVCLELFHFINNQIISADFCLLQCVYFNIIKSFTFPSLIFRCQKNSLKAKIQLLVSVCLTEKLRISPTPWR